MEVPPAVMDSGFDAIASPRNDTKLPLRVAGPGADHAVLAAEFVAFAGGFVERTRNMRAHRITVGTAGVAHVDRECRAGTLHGDRGTFTLALFQRRDAGGILARIIVSLAISAAFADRESARPPGHADKPRSRNRQCQGKHKQGTALRGAMRNDQEPLPSPAARM